MAIFPRSKRRAVVMMLVAVTMLSRAAGDDNDSGEKPLPRTRPPAIVLTSVSERRPSPPYVDRYGITRRDVEVIRASLHNVQGVVPLREVAVQARYGHRKSEARLIGTTPAAANVLTMKIARGRFFKSKDGRTNNVAVIGHRVASRLFPGKNSLGKSVLIDGQYYLVIGITSDRDAPDAVMIPLPTMRARHGVLTIKRSSGSFVAEEFQFSRVIVTVADRRTIDETHEQIRKILRERHGKRKDYSIDVTPGSTGR